MNIKGLLLGSAAAFVAVSGARAADAVVIAEPEPMEYVRICDTYGVGFYYIPGTETCLKVSGYVRYDIGAGALGHQDVLDKNSFSFTPGELDDEGFIRGRRPGTVEYDTNDAWYKRARFTLRVDARSETELGTLRAYANINFNYDTVQSDPYAFNLGATGWYAFGPGQTAMVAGVTGVSTNIGIEHAFIELGGFRAGRTDSMFSTFTGYSSGVSNDGLVPYGPFDTHQLAYTFNAGNGFTAAVALETAAGTDNNYAGVADFNVYTTDSYVPNVVAGVGYTGGWGGVSVVGGYDAVWEEGAIKGRVDVNVNDAISMFVMAGWSSSDDGLGEVYNYYAPWGGEWAAWVGGAWKINEKATANLEIGYDDLENFSVAANIAYELVPNFVITPEIVYKDNFNVWADDYNSLTGKGGANWGGFLRLQANFGG